MPNDHLDRAKSRLHNGTTNEVARAQAEATLALAFEQQTANLIAMLDKIPAPHGQEILHDRIIERLGLS
jgi:hypothetical protein